MSRRTQFAFAMTLVVGSCGGARAVPTSGASALLPSRHGASVCTEQTLASFRPSVGEIRTRVAGPRVEVVGHGRTRFVFECREFAPGPCYDEANKAVARLLAREQTAHVSHRLLNKGTSVTLVVGGVVTRREFASKALLVRTVRDLEARGRTVEIDSIGKAIEFDWSHVDVIVTERRVRSLRVPSIEMAWHQRRATPRRMIENAHILLDEIARHDLVLIDLVTVLAQLGTAVLVPPGVPNGANDPVALAFVAAVAAYPRLPDKDDIEPITLSLALRCRLDFEDQ